MRARPVIKKAYIFDFDDCLFKTSSLIKILDNKTGNFIRSLTPEQFHKYKKQPNHFLDFHDFVDAKLIDKGNPYKGFDIMEKIDKEISNNEFEGDLYVLTARTPHMQNAIFQLLKKWGIRNIKGDQVICMGDGRGKIDIAKEKSKELKKLKKKYDELYFYDDSHDNITSARKLGINTKLIEIYK